MWQSVDDQNNPWRSFRGAGPTTQTQCRSNDEDATQCRHKHSLSSGDENWNSVTVFNGKRNELEQQHKADRANIRQSGTRAFCKDSEIRGIHHEMRTDNNGNGPPFTKDGGSRKQSAKPAWPEGQYEGRHQDREPDPTWDGNGNQWSPFMQHGYFDVSGNGEQVRFEYRQRIDDSSVYSERSSYSTDTDDAQDDGYEFVDREAIEGSENQDGSGVMVYQAGHVTVDMYNTPPSSPPVVHDRYHTAPNSPKSEHGSFCMVDIPDDDDEDEPGNERYNLTSLCSPDPIDHASVNTNCLQRSSYSDVTQIIHHRSTSVNNNYATDAHMDEESNQRQTPPQCVMTENETACLEDAMAKSNIRDRGERMDPGYQNRLPEKYDRSRIPSMDLPPFIDVESIQYEADRKTGAVRTVGKGSFGQVFKARFADPALRHLRIVVKEFNEEFTTRQEILDEAKRLLYLGDTGYVPICYGLVYLGDMNNPTYGLVQEYVGTGVTLERVLWDQYDLEIRLWLSIAFQACEGLARFHEKGILLNDIKSNNIILEFFRTMIRIKYIDFGLATDMRGKRYKNTKSLEDFTYLAPEVRKAGCRTNIASDIYSLGFMLDQICTIAGVHELGFMTKLCMDFDPDSRLPVRSAAQIIYEHMVAFRYDTAGMTR